ncbi:hypothetical protein GPL21_30685 [Bradyrhizobium pachyrhizi]|uniref:Uncharacterized protein n=1 Tax=Bradyrhizobium pachyrhizi TaxID=280333 RepID=A0A844T039_9BRAD|nr:hypothetical protein [Bradyrhizobium pachyrhizi]MVT69464.1 hypothetical protein [Bradyrhizobium pachyrhizi]
MWSVKISKRAEAMPEAGTLNSIERQRGAATKLIVISSSRHVDLKREIGIISGSFDPGFSTRAWALFDLAAAPHISIGRPRTTGALNAGDGRAPAPSSTRTIKSPSQAALSSSRSRKPRSPAGAGGSCQISYPVTPAFVPFGGLGSARVAIALSL